MKWFFNENGKEIEVPLEKWVWRAIYKDGTELYQFDKPIGGEMDGCRFHQIGEIDFQNLAVFEVMNTENPKQRHSIDMLGKSEKPIFFYRRSVLNTNTPQEQRITVYCFGYVVKGVSTYHFILPDDRLVITQNRDIKLLG